MTDEWVLRTLTIANRLGMHARAASQLVRKASAYKAEIFVEKDSVRVNAKSIMGLLMLAAPVGSLLRVTVSGSDAAEAMQAIGALINDGFGER